MEKKSKNTKWILMFLAVLITSIVAWAIMPTAEESNTLDEKEIVLVEKKIDAKADKILKDMSAYLGGLKNFSLTTQGYTEIVIDSVVQKIQLNNVGKISVQRPDRIKAERQGTIADIEMFYDKNKFTVFGKKTKYYATSTTPTNIDQTIDFLRENLNVDLNGGDLLYSNVYDILTEDVVSGMYVGQSMAGNVLCDHLAFSGNEVDFQIWVETGEKKLPRKYVITSKKEKAMPEFSVEIMEWDTNPKFKSDMFTFNPPAGAEKIEFLSVKDIQSKNIKKK